MDTFKQMLRAQLLKEHQEDYIYQWYDPLSIEYTSEKNIVTLFFPHSYFASTFPQSFRKKVQETISELCTNTQSHTVSIEYSDIDTENDKFTKNLVPIQKTTHGPASFENFISSGKNKGLINILQSDIFNYPYIYCPVVIGGVSSTGKTHLLQATANKWASFHTYDVGFYTVEELQSLFYQQGQWKTYNLLCSHQLFILDNLHNLPLTDSLDQLCISLIDTFTNNHKPMLLAGTGHPSAWTFSKALHSRLEQGLWFELPEPDLDVRFRYAQLQAKNLNITISKDYLLQAAQHCTDLRRLLGIIRRFVSHSQLIQRELHEREITIILQQSLSGSSLTPQHIVTCVAERLSVAQKDILGDVRRPELVKARQLAMFLCRELLGHSYSIIGRFFGGKDHSTVVYAVKKIKQLQERDNIMNTLVKELTNTLKNRLT